MRRIKSAFQKWKDTRSKWQKAGDIFFWLLLIMLIIPGPRKVVATAFNTIILQLRSPDMMDESEQQALSPDDAQWMLMDTDGRSLPFSSYLGKPVFLNFWATWCPPCVAELPEIARAFEKHGDKVNFLLVTNQSPEEVKAFLAKREMDLPVYYPLDPIPPGFNHSSLPTTFIISADGKIVERTKGAANWDSRATEKLFDILLR